MFKCQLVAITQFSCTRMAVQQLLAPIAISNVIYRTVQQCRNQCDTLGSPRAFAIRCSCAVMAKPGRSAATAITNVKFHAWRMALHTCRLRLVATIQCCFAAMASPLSLVMISLASAAFHLCSGAKAGFTGSSRNPCSQKVLSTFPISQSFLSGPSMLLRVSPLVT